MCEGTVVMGLDEIDGSDAGADLELSTEMAFKAAAAEAFREAVKAAGPVLLEPVMDVEVVVPEEYMMQTV